MKIKTNITETREVDIELPIFRKQINQGSIEYIGVIEESHTVNVYVSEKSGHTTVSVVPMWIKESDIVRALNEWIEIDEQEFLEAHETALKSLSLRPVLVWSELEQEIDQEGKDHDERNDLQNVL